MAAGNVAIVLLYDPADGTVIHGHYYEVDPGEKLPGQEDLEKSAREHATREFARRERRTSVEGLAALHVDPAKYRMRGVSHRVDPKNRVLVEVPTRGLVS
jgi:hypothetical protein